MHPISGEHLQLQTQAKNELTKVTLLDIETLVTTEYKETNITESGWKRIQYKVKHN